MARNRFWNADNIWNGGASNPRGVARALVEAVDDACAEKGGSDGAQNDAACVMIADHLCFLLGMPQPSLRMDPIMWETIEKEVARRKDE